MGHEVAFTDHTRIEGTPALALRSEPTLHKLAQGLGWFSIALGLGEVFAPRALSRAIGVQTDHLTLLPLLGVRELVAGLGILSRRGRTSTWVKSRVLGDAIDLSLLGAAFGSRKRDPVKLGIAVAAVAAVTALDVFVAVGHARSAVR